jgi:MFS family permease
VSVDFNFFNQKETHVTIKKSFREAKHSYLKRVRIAVSFFFFSTGITFASWASRIPDIKTLLRLSEGDLGLILFAIPLGQLLIMPFSGKLITRFGCYRVLMISMICYLICFTNIGLATNAWQLSLALLCFGFFSNLCNISVNTQGVYTESLFKKNIMGTFHGIWSFAGFTGALVGLGMLALDFSPYIHFLLIAGLVSAFILLNYKFLIKAKTKISNEKKPLFSKPDSTLLWLGIIGFCCMASEGVMFDWSGVYFKEVIKVPKELVVLGYTSFMISMSSGRFLGVYLLNKFGKKNVLQISGLVISTGLFIAVGFPYLITCTLAFMMVGFGVSSVVPTIYSVAGKNESVPASEALTIVSSVSFLGFLLGPPVIGFIAEHFGLQFSFGFIGIFGFFITLMVSRVKALQTS